MTSRKSLLTTWMPHFIAIGGDPREFTLEDLGTGECAGEVVSQSEFTLAARERELFEAQILLDENHLAEAAHVAYRSMVRAAQALVKVQLYYVSEDEIQILTEFRQRFYDTKLFYDKYAGSKFADYLFKARDILQSGREIHEDLAVQLVHEAQLFIDAAHSCHSKIRGASGATRPAAVAGAPAT